MHSHLFTMSVRWDAPHGRFGVGQPISGTLEVQAHQDLEFAGIDFDAFWHTNGQGDAIEDGHTDSSLQAGRWEAGGHYSYPFSLDIPAGPCSYKGDALGVTWFLAVVVHWADGDELRMERTFQVVPAPFDGEYVPGSLDERDRQTFAKDKAPESNLWGGLLFAVLGGGGTVAILVSGGSPYCALFTLAIVLLGGWMLYASIRSRMAETVVGQVHVELASESLRPGETFDVVVTCSPRKNLRLNAATIELHAAEHVWAPTNASDGMGYDKQLFSQTTTVEGTVDHVIHRHESVHLATKITVPEDATPSLYLPDKSVAWGLRVHLDLHACPDWIIEMPLLVEPGRRAAPEPEPVAATSVRAEAS